MNYTATIQLKRTFWYYALRIASYSAVSSASLYRVFRDKVMVKYYLNGELQRAYTLCDALGNEEVFKDL